MEATSSSWRYHNPEVLPRSCTRHLAPSTPEPQRSLHHSATLTEAFQISGYWHSWQAHLTCAAFLSLRFFFCLTTAAPALFAGNFDSQAGPDICRLAPHLQQEWDHGANAHLGSITITPLSGRKVWWSSSKCKTRQLHKWQATVYNRTRGSGCPYNTGRAVCPCNDLAHNHPVVALEWDWEANGARTPETVTASSTFKAAWRCSLCGHSWSAQVCNRTKPQGAGCPQCGREARRNQARQPTVSDGASDLLAEWDWEANETHGWHPDLVTLGSQKKVHWVLREECKLGLVHRWQASPHSRTQLNSGSPFPSGMAVCACNSLGVQSPEAADLWDFPSNGGLTPYNVAVQSNKVMAWMGPDGSQWQQRVFEVVANVMRDRGSEKIVELSL